MSANNEFTKTFIRTFVLAAFVVAGLIINVAAQDELKAFTREELEALKKNASEKLKGKTYRSVETSESFIRQDFIGNFVNKTTYEIVPPDRRRSIIETKEASGVRRDEWIYIGNRTFHKKGDEDWQEISVISEGRGSGGGRGIAIVSEMPEKTVEYKLTRKQIINDQETDLYEVINTSRYESGYSIIFKDRTWFNQDGLFVKTEYERTNTNSTGFFRVTKEYEYDPNIRIEAPLIKEKDKP